MTLPLALALAALQKTPLQNELAEASVDISAPLLMQNPTANPVLSPANIGLTLGMAAMSASDADRPKLLKVFGIEASDSDMRAALREMSQLKWTSADNTREGQDAFLTMAYAAYANRGRTLNPTIEARLKEIFAARTGVVDFSNQSALDEVNTWFEQQTEGRVKNLVQSDFLDGADAFLASALAIKDQWGMPMHALPDTIDFSTQDPTNDMKVLAFGSSGPMQVITKDTAHYVKLPALNTGSYVVLALPRVNGTATAPLQDEAMRGQSDWTRKLVNLRVPKWKAETRWQLEELVQRLQGYRYDLVANAAVTPDRWMHWTKFSADEKGFEGAAASVVGAVTSAPTGEPLNLTFDRPFAYSVVHEATGQVLMLGLVREPIHE